MRMLALMIALTWIPASLLAADDAAITPADAAKKVNEKVTVEFLVKSSRLRDSCFLNSEADHRDAKNFTVFIPASAVENFKKADISDPAAHFQGKTIRVTGTVTLFQEKPQIKVEKPGQIELVKKE